MFASRKYIQRWQILAYSSLFQDNHAQKNYAIGLGSHWLTKEGCATNNVRVCECYIASEQNEGNKKEPWKSQSQSTTTHLVREVGAFGRRELLLERREPPFGSKTICTQCEWRAWRRTRLNINCRVVWRSQHLRKPLHLATADILRYCPKTKCGYSGSTIRTRKPQHSKIQANTLRGFTACRTSTAWFLGRKYFVNLVQYEPKSNHSLREDVRSEVRTHFHLCKKTRGGNNVGSVGEAGGNVKKGVMKKRAALTCSAGHRRLHMVSIASG